MLRNEGADRHHAWVRWAGTILLCIACSFIGGLLGAWWYETFGPPQGRLGDEVEGLQEIAAGAGIGGFAGAFFGWLALGPDRLRPLILMVVAAAGIAGGALVVTGLAYIGSWTNADGPNQEAVIGILGIPAGLALALLTARAAHRRLG